MTYLISRRPNGSVILLLLLCLLTGRSPGTPPARGSAEDYRRANQLRQQVRETVLAARISVHWEDDDLCWYLVKRSPDTHEFMRVVPSQARREPAFDHARLAEALNRELSASYTAKALPFHHIQLAETSVSFTINGQAFRCHLDDYSLTELADDAVSTESSVDPLKQIKPSRRSTRDTSIRFINRRSSAIHLHWIDTDGKRRSYGVIKPGAARDQHTFSGHVWLITNDNGNRPLKVVRATSDAGIVIVGRNTQRPPDREQAATDASSDASPGQSSPDGRWRAVIRNANIWLIDRDGNEQALTQDGTAENRYQRLSWSADSRRLAAIQEQAAQEHTVHLIESSPKDQLQPKLHTMQYLKPGDRIAQPRLRLFRIAGDESTSIAVDQELTPNPWSITRLRWHPDASHVTFLYNQRGHQCLRWIAVEADTGNCRTIIEEVSDTFVDYANKVFCHSIDDTNEVIWMSERDGWNHLYLFDARSGRLKNQVTRGQWVVRRVVRVDSDTRQIWFLAGGIYADQDPYYLHLCRIDFDGSNLTRLTQDDGTHEIEFSPSCDYFVDRWSRVDRPPVTQLKRTDDGQLVCVLERADISRLRATGWGPPVRFSAPGRDGRTPIYGLIYFPQSYNPDSDRIYPVIEQIYAGPHGSFVPKSFAPYRNAQALAELGFIVVRIDGMGTSHRSKAFHDVCWQNLADAGFPDRIEWLRAAANEYPAIDLNRVGIFGGSAGGQSAMRALLAYPDFYKVAVADCGCHDNRMDKIWWNELWMGWPVGEHYQAQSNVTQAHRLEGKLLLTVGELDRNVDPASTMQVVDALIKADKDFQLIVFPGAGHGIGESEYGKRRRRDFFVRHLLRVRPRWTPDQGGSKNEMP